MRTKLNLNKFKEGQVVLVMKDTVQGPVCRLAIVSHFYEQDVEEHVYSRMCAGCEYERRCHVECEHCDEYYEAVDEYEEDENCPKAFYEYALNDSSATWCFTAYENQLLPIENADNFNIIRKTPLDTKIYASPSRQMASRILGQLELYGDMYYKLEDWLTDFLCGREHDMPEGIESEYLRMALRVEVRDYFDARGAIDIEPDDIEKVIDELFENFSQSVYNMDFISDTVSDYIDKNNIKCEEEEE